MDTVYNQQTGPYIQTFIFENTSFMIVILHTNKTADSMSNTLNNFQEKLSDEEYQKLFSLLLTDRGTEFGKPQQFEINMNTGEIRSKIFYCDPQHEIFTFIYGKNLADKLNIHKIAKDEVTTTPRLLK